MINMARINELRQEVGEDDLAEVISIFCEEMDEAMESLDTIAPQDVPGQLHFLKGSALNIGLDSVSELCRANEQRVAEDVAYRPDTAAIRLAYEQSKAALAALV